MTADDRDELIRLACHLAADMGRHLERLAHEIAEAARMHAACRSLLHTIEAVGLDDDDES